MKKNHLISTALLVLILSVPSAKADTPLTGEAINKVFGTVSMYDDPGAAYRTTIDAIANPQIDTGCNITTQTCLMRGFSWSSVLGWTAWNGEEIRAELGGSSFFPDGYMAKATYTGNIGGFIWGEKYGWVALSACAGLDMTTCNTKSYCRWNDDSSPASCDVSPTGKISSIGTQTEDDFGIYIDFCPLKNETECGAASDYCGWNNDNPANPFCEFTGDSNVGHPLKGYAYSEKMGWIKFGADTGDGFSGVYTSWFPDLTPPVPQAYLPDHTWLPVNRGAYAIQWEDFVRDTDGVGIDLAKSIITVTRDTDPIFNGACATQGELDSNPSYLSVNPPSPPAPYSTNVLDLNLLSAGKVGLSQPGFCKYYLSGAIYNSSGFGYYFGEKGKQQAQDDWGWIAGSDPIEDLEPNVYQAAPVTILVRAGDYNTALSTIAYDYYSDSSTTVSPAIADGTDYMEIQFNPRDISMNPILDVKADLDGNTGVPSDEWVRDVSMNFGLHSPYLSYTFDSIFPALWDGIPLPVSINYGLIYPAVDPLDIPLTEDFNFPNLDGSYGSVNDASGQYSHRTTSYAPTINGNSLSLTNLDLELDDEDPLPKLSVLSADRTTAMSGNVLSADIPYNFAPALAISDGDISPELLSTGLAATVQYNLENYSTTTALTDYSIDHVMTFDSVEGALLEIEQIKNPAYNPDTIAGRTNPDNSVTRYLTLNDPASAQKSDDNPFHSANVVYHGPDGPIYLLGTGSVSTIDSQGIFDFASPECTTPPCLLIDRNDPIASSPITLSPSGSSSYSFQLTPKQISGTGLSASSTFGIGQYLSYSTPALAAAFGTDQLSNVYEINSLIDNIEVKALGLGTSGVVSGSQVYESISGRDLDTITTTSSADLRKEIRRNAAVLTRNMESCSTLGNPTLTASGSLPLNGLNCLQVDDVNKTAVVYYSGPGTVTIGSAGNNVLVPNDYRYTIILDQGANLELAGNIYYGNNTKNSLGLIILSDSAGNGANVYITPDPTNLVGLLYAEGSVLSRNSSSQFYYGYAPGNTADLKSQLYWQGSIASSNTIGGAPHSVIPEGVDCTPWGSDIQSCAQAYDLDFIRRFTTTSKDVTYAPQGYTYSGGGSCCNSGQCDVPPPIGDAGCSAPVPLPSTVTISGGVIVTSGPDASKSLNTFFIERDNRPVPPGFTSNGGLTSSQEIR